LRTVDRGRPQTLRDAIELCAGHARGMKWVVGLDLGERSMGALRMAQWLGRRAERARAPRHTGVYVLDERVRTMFQEERAERVVAASREALEGYVARHEASASFAELRVVLAESAEAGLGAAATTIGVDGLVVGRRARADESTLWRLGTTARRLLRHLPTPVMVVPPDLVEVGGGPILFATDLQDESIAAGELAARLATELDRELSVVHVDPVLALPASELGLGMAMPVQLQPRTIDDLERWLARHHVRAGDTRLLEGDTIDRLLHCAKRTDAAMLVCGSRCLSVAERIFTSSVATELARHSDRPILVVPAR
jgi:nucleotide-binding universal stress UspA family protein